MNNRWWMRIQTIGTCLLAGVMIMGESKAADKKGKTKIHREYIEWCDQWVPAANKKQLPRVLLVGDSIVKGYYGAVEEALKGKAAVARMATSAFLSDPAYLQQLDCLLDGYEFDVIHFNNGRHGFGYSEKEYAEALPRVIAHIREKQPQATLILACTTPVRESNETKKQANARIRERNRAVGELAQKLGLEVDDLYALDAYKPEAYVADGAHFTGEIRSLQGRHIAEVLSRALAARKTK